MAVDEGLAERVEGLVAGVEGMAVKRMFGGLAFLLDGSMSVGIIGSDLIVRVGADGYDEALSEPGVRPFDMTGRPMRGWVLVSHEATSEDSDLAAWVERGVSYASTIRSEKRR
jgi:TfoX/Sxy family transcriptional regulator of competence genes